MEHDLHAHVTPHDRFRIHRALHGNVNGLRRSVIDNPDVMLLVVCGLVVALAVSACMQQTHPHIAMRGDDSRGTASPDTGPRRMNIHIDRILRPLNRTR